MTLKPELKVAFVATLVSIQLYAANRIDQLDGCTGGAEARPWADRAAED